MVALILRYAARLDSGAYVVYTCFIRRNKKRFNCFDLEQENVSWDVFQTLPVNSHVAQILKRKNSITESVSTSIEYASEELLNVLKSFCVFVTGKVLD